MTLSDSKRNCDILYNTVLCYTTLYCIILYYTVLYCILLFYTLSYCIILYYAIPYSPSLARPLLAPTLVSSFAPTLARPLVIGRTAFGAARSMGGSHEVRRSMRWQDTVVQVCGTGESSRGTATAGGMCARRCGRAGVRGHVCRAA